MALIRSVGIDPSTTGTCLFELQIDSNTMQIIGCDYYLFNTTQKLAKASPNIIYINPKSPTYIKIDETVAYLESMYLQNNVQTIFTTERFVPSSAKARNEDWKGIYHVTEHYLRRYKKFYSKIFPVSLKKYATGYGKAEKSDMGLAFTNDGFADIDLSFIPDTKNPKDDPKSNVWDAYFLAEIGYYTLVAQTLGIDEFKKIKNVPAHKVDLIIQTLESPIEY